MSPRWSISPRGPHPRLPKTRPSLPILIDSSGWDPTFDGGPVDVRIPFEDIGVVEGAGFDGITPGLRVNESVHAPPLCVVDVMDVASDDLSLPGRVNR